ncbi:MAG: hypothetical protein AAFY82_03930 [Pseudomonadota bacterium]
MISQDLPKDESPLTPLGYWQESLAAWADFSQRSGKILMSQTGQGRGKMDADAEPVTAELLRTLSDFNLRHWQNTARLLEGFPAWTQMPSNMTGSALVDWFDTLQRQRKAFSQTFTQPPQTAPAARPDTDGLIPPKTLPAPEGSADDLTRIKGIGPKLSSKLNDLGIYHFKQIADWSDAEAKWVEEYLSFKGRVSREKWIPQALTFVTNGSASIH